MANGRPTLFLLLGYPGSGKSTFSKQLCAAEEFVRINSDELRDYMYGHSAEAHNPKHNPPVFGALDYMAAQLLKAGRSVMYDANNNRRRERIKHEQLAADSGAKMVVLWVRVPVEVARQRELRRQQDPQHLPISAELYGRMAAALQEPQPDEVAIAIDGAASFADQLQAFSAQMKTINGLA
jgi:predicted kinase